jgi:hypothetical protein
VRASEFEKAALGEAKQGKLTSGQHRATRGLHLYSDGEHVSSDYTQYRLSLALACADGKNPVEMDSKSWIGKKKSAHPYSKIEHNMLKDAYKAVGASHEDLNHGDLDSREDDDVHKVSPTAVRKKNRYGV